MKINVTQMFQKFTLFLVFLPNHSVRVRATNCAWKLDSVFPLQWVKIFFWNHILIHFWFLKIFQKKSLKYGWMKIMFFSLDKPVTKNQIIITNVSRSFLLLFQFIKRRGQHVIPNSSHLHHLRGKKRGCQRRPFLRVKLRC